MSDNYFDIKGFLDSDPGWRAGRVLDVRPGGVFAAGHLKGAVSHPLCPSCLPEEVPSLILPPRHEPLLVVGQDGQNCDSLARELESRGRVGVTVLRVELDTLARLPISMVDKGFNRNHLWAAPEWLLSNLDLLPPPALGPVLDLGCGSGRAAVFLAERGYRVTGLDRQPEALEMGRWLADNRGVACDFRQVDLRQPEAVPPGPWAVILNFRFLQREMLVGFHKLLLPGGLALVSTFREAPGYQGHPHPRHRLARNELPGFFPGGQFQILAHQEGFDPDGRPSAGIAVRRRN